MSIGIPKEEIELLVEELASIRYRINSKGLIQIEEKERMKARVKRSPDRADMLMMLMEGGGEDFIKWMNERDRTPSAAEMLRREMRGW